MDKVQKIHDKKMREIRSFSRNDDEVRKTERIRNIIRDLEHYGPAGLIHVSVLSNIIGKSIKIWNANTSLNSVIGKGPAINIEYHANNVGGIGHWTLIQAKDPVNVEIDLNSCLFSVIGSQTGLNPLELRRWTLLRLKGNLRQLADQLDKIVPLIGSNNELILMIGGARYIGTSANDARLILDKSQNARCYSHGALGHPRGHASDPEATASGGRTDSVENYSWSTGSSKTGFLSRSDQDSVTHFALSTDYAQNAMQKLNQGSTNEVVEIWASMLRVSYPGIYIPRARWYSNGNPIGEGAEMRTVLMVLRHHEAHYRNPEADVFVHTCYPKI